MNSITDEKQNEQYIFFCISNSSVIVSLNISSFLCLLLVRNIATFSALSILQKYYFQQSRMLFFELDLAYRLFQKFSSL